MADNENSEVQSIEPTTEQSNGNEETSTAAVSEPVSETNPAENGDNEIKADIKPSEEEEEKKEDKPLEEGGLINATEDNES